MDAITATSWLTSIASVCVCWFMARKVWWAPILGLSTQALWYAFALMVGAYPLLIAITLYTAIYIKAIPKWYKGR